MRNKQPLDIATAATQNSDRRMEFTLLQRTLLAAIIGQQGTAKVKVAINREVNDDDMGALWSIRRKIQPAPEETLPYMRNLGGNKNLDIEAMSLASKEVGARKIVLDGFESKLLKAFLSGWLKNDGSIADRDWAVPVIENCQ